MEDNYYKSLKTYQKILIKLKPINQHNLSKFIKKKKNYNWEKLATQKLKHPIPNLTTFVVFAFIHWLQKWYDFFILIL